MPRRPLKHAVIVAHPGAKSFSLELARAYADAAAGLGQDCVVRDLYRIGFDPCLRLEEIPGPQGYRCGADVQAERDAIGSADVFAFVYPFWFNAPPAMLKGYVDRVFSTGFGYQPGPGGNEALLDGKRLISFSTSGAPDHWIKETAALDTLVKAFDRHLAAVCGMSVVDHVHFGSVTPDLTADSAKDILETVRATVRKAFDPSLSEVG